MIEISVLIDRQFVLLMVPHFGSRDSLISHFNQKMSRGGGCSSWLAFIVPNFNFLSSHLLTGTRFFVLIIYKYTTDLLYVMSVRDLYCFYKIQTSTKFTKNCHKVPIYSGLRFIFSFAFTVLPLIFYEVLHLWFSSQISKAYGMTLMEHLMTRGTWFAHFHGDCLYYDSFVCTHVPSLEYCAISWLIWMEETHLFHFWIGYHGSCSIASLMLHIFHGWISLLVGIFDDFHEMFDLVMEHPRSHGNFRPCSVMLCIFAHHF